MKIVQFQRKPNGRVFSVENLFSDVRAAFSSEVEVELRVNEHFSTGLVPRLADAVTARRHKGELRHILGDVHYLAWLMPRRGTVLTVLDCVSLERMSGPKLKLFWLLWYWLPLQRAERVTVISEFTRASLQRWVRYPSEKIHVIPPPLSPEFTAAPPPPRADRLRLLQIGTTVNKNVERVIEAIAGLPVSLTIIGAENASIREALARFDVSHRWLHNLSREEVVEQYRQAHALVFASTYEGFGMPIIEAQAVGRPVITSKLCSMPEAAGDAALFVDPFKVQEIRAAVQRLIDDQALCESLVEKGYSNAARFAPERIAAQYAEVYRLVAEGDKEHG